MRSSSSDRPGDPAPSALGGAWLAVGLLCAAVLVSALLAGCTGDLGPDAPSRPGAFYRFSPVPALARRMTADEYVHTLDDVLGVRLSEDDRRRFPQDLPLGGFVNTAQGQATLPDHVLALNALAGRVVEELDLDAFLTTHAACLDATEACAEGFVRSAGALLFRRPLDDRETESFVSLLTFALDEGATFARASEAVLEAMLQSPQFIYLMVDERPGGPRVRDLDGYELASRLAFFLWSSAPDEELLRAAEAGELDSADGLAAQAQRLLADEARARRSTARFIFDWARLSVLPDGDGLREELQESAVAFYQAHLWEDRAPLLALFTSQKAVLTPTLAEAYGVRPLGDGLETYDLSELPSRLGLLTQPGIIAGMTNADGGAIVARGLFQLAQLYCSPTPSPPAELDTIIEEFVAELPEDASDRFIAETRLERPDCGYCHSGFDPVAYGFEAFDFRGAYRTQDERGNPVTTDGWVPAALSSNGLEQPYGTLEEYAATLVDNPQVQACFVKRHLEYALGTQLADAQRGAVEELAAYLVQTDADYPTLVDAIVRHDVFRRVALEDQP